MGFELEGFGEERGGVDVGVAVDLAVAEEVGVFEAGDEAEDSVLLAELEVVLEADEVVAVGAEVFLAELDYGVGPAAGFGVGEAYGLHGAEAEGVAASAGGLFDGEAAFEVLEFFEFLSSRELWTHVQIGTWGTQFGASVGICSQDLAGTASAVVRASRKRSYSSLVKGQLM